MGEAEWEKTLADIKRQAETPVPKLENKNEEFNARVYERYEECLGLLDIQNPTPAERRSIMLKLNAALEAGGKPRYATPDDILQSVRARIDKFPSTDAGADANVLIQMLVERVEEVLYDETK